MEGHGPGPGRTWPEGVGVGVEQGLAPREEVWGILVLLWVLVSLSENGKQIEPTSQVIERIHLGSLKDLIF